MKRFRIIMQAGAITCLLICFQLSAQVPREYQLKATSIYNVLQFVEWPPEILKGPESPLVIDILGDDPFGTEIDRAFVGKKVNGHSVVIDRVKALDPNHACHVLFVCRSERDRLPKILELIGDQSVFSIGDVEGFAKQGGMLNFVNEDNKPRFEINLAAVKRARLQVSSKLLRLSKIVEKKGS